jgi:hypothetical protein
MGGSVTKKRRLELLAGVWLFEQCSRRELNVLQDATTEMQLTAGKLLTEQGEVGRHFMVIVEGSVEVTRDGTQIAVLGPGAFFGEMSLLDGQPRTATRTHADDGGIQRSPRHHAFGRSEAADRAGRTAARHRSEIRSRRGAPVEYRDRLSRTRHRPLRGGRIAAHDPRALGAEPDSMREDCVGDIGDAMVSRSGMFSHQHQCLIGTAVCLDCNALLCSRDLYRDVAPDIGRVHRRFIVRCLVLVPSGG